MDSDILAASTRRSLTANQIDLARQRYEDLIRIGFKGGVFKATDEYVMVIQNKVNHGTGWGAIVMDTRNHPFFLSETELRKFLGILIEANTAGGRAYLMEYEKIITSSKEDLVKGDS